MTRLTMFLAALAIGLVPLTVSAEETGVDRAMEGAADTVTSPGQIVEGLDEETKKHGAVGVVTGSVKGGANAAAQAVKGAAGVGVGVVEAVTKPLTGGD